MIKKILRYIQHLLIKWIVGKRQVVMNTTINGNVIAKGYSILINNQLTEGKEIKIQLFKDKNRKWRFRLVSANKKILCSSEAYSRKNYCKHTADLIRKAKMVVVEK